MVIDWENIYKLRISNSQEGMQFHEVVKLLILMKLLEKHKRHHNYIRVYTEFPIKNGRRCDVYYENIRTKEAYAYEVQKNMSKDWLSKVQEDYKDWEVPFMKTSDLVVVDLNKLSKNIDELSKQLNEVIM